MEIKENFYSWKSMNRFTSQNYYMKSLNLVKILRHLRGITEFYAIEKLLIMLNIQLNRDERMWDGRHLIENWANWFKIIRIIFLQKLNILIWKFHSKPPHSFIYLFILIKCNQNKILSNNDIFILRGLKLI